MDKAKILQPNEIALVLADLNRRAKRSTNSRMNLVIFRLSACCGLRASEIAGLTLADVQVDTLHPSLRLRAATTKGHKPRRVPLNLDAGTLADIRDWKQFRIGQGGDKFVCSQHKDSLGNPLERRGLRLRFKAACKCLGPERCAQLSIHDGRHTFVSISLFRGRDVVAVQHDAGHANIATTSGYAHLVDTDDTVGNLFDFSSMTALCVFRVFGRIRG
jgi:integrase